MPVGKVGEVGQFGTILGQVFGENRVIYENVGSFFDESRRKDEFYQNFSILLYENSVYLDFVASILHHVKLRVNLK